MKKIVLYIFKVIAVLVLSIQHYVFAQGSWEWQNPLPQGADMRTIIALSPNRAIIGGICGAIMMTEDGGQNWLTQRLPQFDCIIEYSFISENEGWIIQSVSNESKIFKTNNGGMDWQELDISIDIDFSIYGLNDIEFVNSHIGYILAVPNPSNSIYPGLIYKTEDGGLNWTQIDSWTGERLYQVTFTDSLNGFLLSGTYGAMKTNLHATNDGGNTWETLPDSGYGNIHFVSSRVAWAGNFKTTDGGETWNYQEFNFPDLDNSIDKIYFEDSLTGYAISNRTIIKTTDGGNSWSIQIETDRSSLNDIKFYNKDIGWVCGRSGTIFKTIDAGEHWIGLDQGITEDLNDVVFIDAETGCAVGDNGSILHTDNGGITWEVQESNIEKDLLAVDFVNKNDGWAVGGDYILHTSNSGKEWKINSHLDLEDGGFTDVTFPDENTGFLIGYFQSLDGVIFRTKDGGQTWQQNSGYTGLTAISFIDKQYGWICVSGTVLATMDGGETWEEQNTQDIHCTSLQFVDPNHGWATYGEALFFYRTTDGGITWLEVPWRNYYNGICRFFFIDQNTGWASSCYVGDISKTTDGGQTWEFQDCLPVYRINSLFFINSGLGWAVGSDGAILQYKDVSSSTVNSVLPSSPDMCVSNYPNPFNPQTTIRYQLPKAGHVKLQVFDLSGRLVQTLVDENQPTGEYSKIWNAENVSSGIYFYRLETKDLTSVKKCVKLK